MGDLIISLTRTWAAMLAGFLIAWAVRQGIGVDASVQQPLTEVLTAVFGAAYYLIVRVIEHGVPAAGWLLGAPRKPVYAAPEKKDPPVRPV